MICGDFHSEDQEKELYWQSLGYTLILLTNVLLLNLIVAIMGDTYSEVITTSE